MASLLLQHPNTHLRANKRAGLRDLPAIQYWQEGAPHGRARCQSSHLQNQYPCSIPGGANGPIPAPVEGEATDLQGNNMYFRLCSVRADVLPNA